MRRVVISGGNGYIGSSLVRRLLAQGVDVHALANENHQRLDGLLPPGNIHVLTAGAGDAVEVVTRVQPDTIFHLAAVYSEPVSMECILNMIQGNLTLGACLLYGGSHCQELPVFVNTGTYWQFSTDGTYHPNTLYAATKQAFLDILQFYRDRSRIRSTTLVLYDSFGPGDDRGKLWSRLLHAAPGTRIPLTEGHQQIQPVHIDDTVAAFVRAAELLHTSESLGAMYSVHSGATHTLRSVVESLNERAHLQLDLGWGESEYWPGQVYTPWLGETLPGWRAQHDVLESLVQMAGEARLQETAR